MKDFKKRVLQLAENKDSDLIKNKGVQHASYLLSVIIDNSESIKMFSGSLSRELTESDDYMNSLKNFLNRKETSLQLLLQNSPKPENRSEALRLILSHANSNPDIDVKVLNDYSIYKLLTSSNDNNDVHFTIGDEDKYRFEYQPEEYRARASFNDKETNETLGLYFDAMFKDADQL